MRNAFGEPFRSKAQQRFAFGTDQPWALKWAHATPNIKRLPQHVRKKKSNEGNTSTAMGQLMRKSDGSAELAALKKGKAPKGGTDPTDDLYQERDFDKNVGGGVDRDKIPAQDFAGSGRSFPIVTKGDVSDAIQSLGRTNQDRGKVRKRIVAIAKRKGFPVPKSSQTENWQNADHSHEADIPISFGRAHFIESF